MPLKFRVVIALFGLLNAGFGIYLAIEHLLMGTGLAVIGMFIVIAAALLRTPEK